MYTWFVATLLSIDMSLLWTNISHYAIYVTVFKMLAFYSHNYTQSHLCPVPHFANKPALDKYYFLACE